MPQGLSTVPRQLTSSGFSDIISVTGASVKNHSNRVDVWISERAKIALGFSGQLVGN